MGGILFLAGRKFPPLQHDQAGFGLTLPPCTIGTVGSSPGLWSEREADDSASASNKVTACSFTTTPTRVSMT
jgi:hypothetical protein